MNDFFKIDLHTHTCASGHGTKDTITDLAREASARGISILGISDHGPATMGSAKPSYFRGLSVLNRQDALAGSSKRRPFGVRLLLGVEANILDKEGHLDLSDEILASLDYVIVSMHLPIYTPGSVKENTLAYQRAMEHPKVRIIGHCDDPRFPVNYDALVSASLQRGVLPELNNVSLLSDSYRGDCRPGAIRLLDACRRLNYPILLSSDSHGKEQIGCMAQAFSLTKERAFPASLIGNLHPERLPFSIF